MVTEPRALGVASTLDPEAVHGPWQNEQVFTPPNAIISRPLVQTPSSPSLFPNVESDMFYAQFRTVGDEYWEETQREFQKPWIVLSNLLPSKCAPECHKHRTTLVLPLALTDEMRN